MKIQNSKRLGIKFLIFGGYGVGKTVFASTLPQPIYFFDFDLGVKSVASYHKKRGRLDEVKIDYDTYRDDVLKRPQFGSIRKSRLSEINTTPTAYLDFEDKLNDILEDCRDVKSEHGINDDTTDEQYTEYLAALPYRTVVIDSLSYFVSTFIAYIMSVNDKQGRVFAVPNQNDYGNFVRKIEEAITMFHLLAEYGVHTVVNAHMQLKEDIRGPKDNTTYRGIFRVPAVVGKDVPFKIGALFDEVYYAFVEREDSEVHYMFETKSDDDLFCKSRSSEIGMYVEQSWPKISNALMAEYD